MAGHRLRALIPALALTACGSPIDQRAVAADEARSVELDDAYTVKVDGATVLRQQKATRGQPGKVTIRAQSFDARVEIEATHCEPRTVVLTMGPLPEPAGGKLPIAHRPLLDAVGTVVDASRKAGGAVVDFTADPDDPDRTPVGAEEKLDCPVTDHTLVWTVHLNPHGERTYRIACGEEDAIEGDLDVACLTTGAAPGVTDTAPAGPLAAAPFIVRQRIRGAVLDAHVVRFAVFANNDGHADLREQFVKAANASDPPLDFAIINGDLTSDGSTSALKAARAAYDELAVPWFATVGERDVDGASAKALVGLLGATSFAFDTGPARIIVLDSADAGLSPDTHDLLDGWLKAGEPLAWPASPGPAPRLVFTHYPPFPPSDLSGNAFKSRREAARFVAELRHGGVEHLVTGHIGIFEKQDVAGVEVVHSGGGGAPMERIGNHPHHWLRITACDDQAVRDGCAEPVIIDREDL
jgi:hypothetical protein